MYTSAYLYISLIVRLLYVSMVMRPDIVHVLVILSKHSDRLKIKQWRTGVKIV